jgi:Methyltransferase FkbM domain
MIKELIKKSGIYKGYKNRKDQKKFKEELAEVYKRAKDLSFMKDSDQDEKDRWRERIDLVVECPDSQKIDLLPNTAKLIGDYFVMHNGIKILPLSYYGYPVLQMLHENKSIHEPQEEYAFQEVLKALKPGAVMIELGAYWSFYSMWFAKEIKNSKNYMIEPWEIEHGIRNFKINDLKGEFFQYYISSEPGVHHDGSKIISVDSFVKDESIDFVDVLHSDIQGSELDMLNGASYLLDAKKVGYIFVSTHSNELHDNCANFLKDKGYIQVCSANMDETYSYDGLLVFKNPEYEGPESIEISLRSK